MTKVSVMRKNFQGTDWKRAFAESVMRLRPDMNPDRADELSDAEYAKARNVDPNVAAMRWLAQEEGGSESSIDRASNGK